MEIQPGIILLGKFRIEQVLGRGGMGVVVAVRHVALDELFAMKLMHEEMLTNTDAIARFVREARAAARLKGEHVARVNDVGRLENGAPYMLMEHLVGNDLSAMLDKRGPLPVGLAAMYVLQACEAIAEAHGYGIVHRDLKPANLFLTMRANGTPCIKVLDFGISKTIDPMAQFEAKLTTTGAFMGTPAFMSPEQMKDGKTVDARSDIWAIGAILYELTTGLLPFQGETMGQLMAAVLSEPATPPSSLRPDIPGAFDEVVLRCLQKKQMHRYQTIDELMADLRPFVTADIIPVPRGSRPSLPLPRLDDDLDSLMSTRNRNNPLPYPATPIMALPRVDDSVDSMDPTKLLKPPPQIMNGGRLPNALDTEFSATSGNTVDMTTQYQRPPSRPDMTPLPRNDAASQKSSKASKVVFLGIGVLTIGAVGAFAATQVGGTSPSNGGVEPQPSALAVPGESTAKPVESSVAVVPLPSTSAEPSASASSSAIVTTKSTAPSTTKPISKTPVTKKPSLY